MAEKVLNREALPDAIFQIIKTEEFVLREVDGKVEISPFYSADALYGIAADWDISVDKFLANKRLDKIKEEENDKRRRAGL